MGVLGLVVIGPISDRDWGYDWAFIHISNFGTRSSLGFGKDRDWAFVHILNLGTRSSLEFGKGGVQVYRDWACAHILSFGPRSSPLGFGRGTFKSTVIRLLLIP